MQYPNMKAGTRLRLAVDALDGGLDMQAAPDRLEDNRLSGCRNLWWKEGALRTRPGIRALPGQAEAILPAVSDQPAAEDAVQPDAAGRAIPVRRFLRREGGTLSVRTLRYDGVWEQGTGVITGSGGRSLTFDYGAAAAEWGVDTDGVIVLDSNGRMLARLADGSGYIDLEGQLYAPLLWKDGRGSANYGEVAPPEGSSPESPNLLTGRFRAQYTTDGEAAAFYLPLKGLDDLPVTAAYTNSQGTVITHTVPAGTVRGPVGADGRCMNCVRAWGVVYFTDGESGQTSPLPMAGVENNFEVTAVKSNEANRALVYNMGLCTWFGGDRSVKNGGGRLYLAGNPAHPAVICWSAPGNPLYFPADNRALVGDAGQAVRAFGRLGERLVIFKDREMLAASYAAAETATAGFPLAQLHTGVGCSVPDTVALCGDRLIWAFDRKVYGLHGGKVQCLSGGVGKLLSALSDDDWGNASAAAYAGGWLLLVGQQLLFLDLKGEEPAWYCWDAADTGLTLERVLACGDQGVLLGQALLNGQNVRLAARLEGEADAVPLWRDGAPDVAEQPIACAFATRLFDFGRPLQRKTIHRAALGLAGPGAGQARFYTLSEWGRKPDSGGWLPAAWESELVLERPLLAGAARVRRYGLAMETRGAVAVGRLLADATLLGEE